MRRERKNERKDNKSWESRASGKKNASGMVPRLLLSFLFPFSQNFSGNYTRRKKERERARDWLGKGRKRERDEKKINLAKRLSTNLYLLCSRGFVREASGYLCLWHLKRTATFVFCYWCRREFRKPCVIY